MVPDWLQGLAPLEWYEHYGKRIEDTRLPRSQAAREAYAQTVGEDGFRVLDALERPEAPENARALPSITSLRRTWQRHYERGERPGSAPGDPPILRVRFKANQDLPRAAEGVESPYDTEARYRHKRDTPVDRLYGPCQ